MGTLSKQHGRYFVQFYHKNRTPKRKRVSLQTGKKRDAEALRSKLEHDYLVGLFDPWSDDPLTYDRKISSPKIKTCSEALSQFLAEKEAQGKSPNTINTYRWIVSAFLESCNVRDLREVTAQHVTIFVRDDSVSKSTRRTRYTHLRTFFRWAVRTDLLISCPTDAVEPPEKPHKLPKSISSSELFQISAVLRADYNSKRQRNLCREDEILWQIPLYHFASCTGMRVSELARLRWKHIDFDKRLVYIYEQKNKKEQTVPLNRKAEAVLAAVQSAEPEDYVFRSPRQKCRQRKVRRFAEHVSRTFSDTRKLAGIDRKVTFHSLRHGFCTKLAEAGKPLYVIKEAARHADVSTSMRYVHMANKHLQSELDEVFG